MKNVKNLKVNVWGLAGAVVIGGLDYMAAHVSDPTLAPLFHGMSVLALFFIKPHLPVDEQPVPPGE